MRVGRDYSAVSRFHDPHTVLLEFMRLSAF